VKPEEKRRLGLLVALLVVVAAVAYWPRGDSNASARERAQAAGRRAGSRPSSSSTLSPEAVPTLLPLDARSPGGPVERDIFHFAPPTPTRVPTKAPPTPTPFPRMGEGSFIGPRPLSPTPTATPIIPPPIPYKLIGRFGPDDRPIAAFEESGRLINAREGDVLDGRFIVRKVNRESVDFAFVGLPSDITRRLAMSEAGR